MDPYIGEIRPFTGIRPPANWHFCDGTTLPITGNELLYSLIGTTYGGDGRATFGLPNLQASVPIGQGQGTGLTNRVIGSSGGSQQVALTAAQLPNHTHTFTVSTVTTGNVNAPSNGSYLGNIEASSVVDPVGYLPQSATGITPTPMNINALTSAGSSGSHENQMPYVVINYIIAMQGIYPVFP